MDMCPFSQEPTKYLTIGMREKPEGLVLTVPYTTTQDAGSLRTACHTLFGDDISTTVQADQGAILVRVRLGNFPAQLRRSHVSPQKAGRARP